VTWLPWRRKLELADEKVRAAERLRDDAEEQRTRATSIVPRVDTVSTSLQRLRKDNHFGPLIDAILRGSE
jgi:hypothetical protein